MMSVPVPNYDTVVLETRIDPRSLIKKNDFTTLKMFVLLTSTAIFIVSLLYSNTY